MLTAPSVARCFVGLGVVMDTSGICPNQEDLGILEYGYMGRSLMQMSAVPKFFSFADKWGRKNGKFVDFLPGPYHEFDPLRGALQRLMRHNLNAKNKDMWYFYLIAPDNNEYLALAWFEDRRGKIIFGIIR